MRTGRLLALAVLAGLPLLPGAARAQYYWPRYGYYRPYWRPYYAYGWPYYRPFWRPPLVYAVPPPAYGPPPVTESAYGIPYAPRPSARRSIRRASVRRVPPAVPATPIMPVAPQAPAPPSPSHDVYPPERPGD